MKTKQLTDTTPLTEEWIAFIQSLHIPSYSDGNSLLLAQLVALVIKR